MESGSQYGLVWVPKRQQMRTFRTLVGIHVRALADKRVGFVEKQEDATYPGARRTAQVAKRALVKVPPLEDYGDPAQAGNVVPLRAAEASGQARADRKSVV